MIPAIVIQAIVVIASIILCTILYFLTEYTASIYGSVDVLAASTNYSAVAKNIPLQRVTDIPTIPSRAVIRCSVVPPLSDTSFTTAGYNDCRTMFQFFEGDTACASGCLGLGSCANVCPSDAIIFSENHIYVTDSCIGCGLCVPLCPKNLISLMHLQDARKLPCAAAEKHTQYENCPIKTDEYFLDFRKFPQSGFKKLQNWGIITKK